MNATRAAVKTAKAIEQTQAGQADVMASLIRIETKIDRLIELAEMPAVEDMPIEKPAKKGVHSVK